MLERRQDAGAVALSAEVVIRLKPAPDAVGSQQLAAMPRILAKYGIGGCQHEERPDRNVAEVSDGRGHNIEARRQRRCGEFIELTVQSRGKPGLDGVIRGLTLSRLRRNRL